MIEVKLMRKWLLSGLFCSLLASSAFAAKGPEIGLVDNKLSIDAETVPLARLLRLLDMATGMKSKVPPELANRNISVKFSDLNLTDGVRKIFQGQPVDYVLIEGQGIIVTASSQNITGTESVPAYNAGPAQPEQPFVQEFQGQQQLPPVGIQPGMQGQQQQPAMIQTPFGPMANPRANQAQQAPNTQGQQNALFPNAAPQNQPQPAVAPAPNGQPVNPNPFGTPSPFGTTTPFSAQPQTSQPNSLFGSPPPVFNNSATH
jgi:hypothetical protein